MEKGNRIRKNGFSKPLGFLQIFTWICFVSDFFVFIFQVFPRLESHERILIGTLYFILYLCLIISAFLLTYTDPTDPLIDLYRLTHNDQ
jgi:hypothetical protein